MRILAVTFLLFAGSVMAPISAAAQDCPLYLLERAGDGFRIRGHTIRVGQAEAFPPGGDLVTLVLPWSPGQSGDVIQAVRPAFRTVRCEPGTLRVTVQEKGGEPRALPPVDISALQRYRMRVSVTPAEGEAAAFIVEPGGGVVRDMIAPPTDMFQGRVPLQPGDVSVTTEVREVVQYSAVEGRAQLMRGGPYLLTRLSIPGGGTGDVIVDLGASRTLLSRDMLPPGVEVMSLVAEEHGPEGVRTLPGSAGALGGEVEGISTAVVPVVEVGGLRFSGVSVNVLPKLPSIAGLDVKGILGNNFLQEAPVTRLSQERDEGGLLELSSSRLAAEPDLTVPFSLVGGLIVMEGSAGGQAMPLILDTGARSTLFSEKAAQATGLTPVADDGDTFRGLGGKPVKTWGAVVEALHLGDGTIDSLPVRVGELSVLDRMGLAGGGLLGQNLWDYYSTLEVEWVEGVVRFYR